MSDSDKTFTRFERLILTNQMRILEALYPDEAESIAVQREAIERGYELLYRWQAEHIYEGDDVMTAEECLEVWDTLDMFDAINRAIKRLEKPEYFERLRSKFAGYDGNYESKFMAFAAFTVQRMGRFDYVPLAIEGSFNSHAPMREIYGRMRTVWTKLGREQGFNMDEQQLLSVLDAAIHPENRSNS